MKITSSNLGRLACFLFVVVVYLPTTATAGTINVIVSNVDVQYSGGTTGTLFEVDDPDFGSSNPADSQVVTSAEFELDGVSQSLLMNPPTNIWVDLLVPNLGPSLTLGSLQSDQGGGPGTDDFAFELFTGDGFSLQLGIDSINYVAVDIPIAGTGLFNFFAEAKVLSQNLPAGLAFQEDVLLSFIATDAAFLGGPNTTTGLLSSGALTITGQSVVPEPASLTMGVLGLLSIACLRQQRKV